MSAALSRPGIVSRPRAQTYAPIFIHLVAPGSHLCPGCGALIRLDLPCCSDCADESEPRDPAADDRDRLATETDAARWALSGVR